VTVAESEMVGMKGDKFLHLLVAERMKMKFSNHLGEGQILSKMVVYPATEAKTRAREYA
jgi:hypothetical protein